MWGGSHDLLGPGGSLVRFAQQVVVWVGLFVCSLCLAVPTTTLAEGVTIASPANGADVSGSVPLAINLTGRSNQVKIYVDGSWVASAPPSTLSWNSSGVSDGTHVIAAKAFSPSGKFLGGQRLALNVHNTGKKPTPSPTSKPTATSTRTPTPTAVATPVPTVAPTATTTATATIDPTLVPTATATPTATPLAHYVDNSGSPACSDSGSGSSPLSPWCTVSRAVSAIAAFSPGEQVLFKCGDSWNEQFTIPTGTHGTAGNNIVIGHYGTNCVLPGGAYTATLPAFNGGSTLSHGIYAPITSSISYVTIDGFDVHDTTLGGINIVAYQGSKPGFIIENNLVHETGPGACAGCGLPTDTGSYDENAGISFNDDGSGNGLSYSDNVQILNNTVWDTGGHNTLRVHFDGGPSMLVYGNTVGPGCIHNCIDTKGINGTVSHNLATCPSSSARGAQCVSGNAAFYSENPAVTAGTHGHWLNDVAYDVPVGFQIMGPKPNAPILYDNTIYGTTQYGLYFGCTDLLGDIRKDLLQGTIAYASSCILTWDYNDTFKSTGGLNGLNDIDIDPAYVVPSGTPPDFHTTDSTVDTVGAGSSVTPQAYLGAMGPP